MKTAGTRGSGCCPARSCGSTCPKGYTVPHMGWNQLDIRRPAPLLEGIAEGTYVYFVHSYYVAPKDSRVIATETDYGGSFCSMIWRDNVFATQFHPEKSQSEGLRMLRNFAELRA